MEAAAKAYHKAYGDGEPTPLSEDPEITIAKLTDRINLYRNCLYVCARKPNCTCKSDCLCDDDEYHQITNAKVEILSGCKALVCLTGIHELKQLRSKKVWRIFALTDEDEEIPIMDMGVNNEFIIIGGPSYGFVDRRKRDRSITLTFNYLCTI